MVHWFLLLFDKDEKKANKNKTLLDKVKAKNPKTDLTLPLSNIMIGVGRGFPGLER